MPTNVFALPRELFSSPVRPNAKWKPWCVWCISVLVCVFWGGKREERERGGGSVGKGEGARNGEGEVMTREEVTTKHGSHVYSPFYGPVGRLEYEVDASKTILHRRGRTPTERRQRDTARGLTTDTKVTQLDLSVSVDEDVGRFDVAVENALFIAKVREADKYLQSNVAQHFLRHPPHARQYRV